MESFRNLEAALKQAEQNSINDNSRNCNQAKNLFESFRNLDDATAQAIQNSLGDNKHTKGRSLFESFRNLDGALNQAKLDSLETERDRDYLDGLSLDEQLAMAMENSLKDVPSSVGVDQFRSSLTHHQQLERLEEDSSESESEEEEDDRKPAARPGSGVGIQHVSQPAPGRDRRARRQADQRFNSGKLEGREGGLEGADRPGKDLTQSTMTFLSECNLDAEDFEALPEDVQGDIMEEKGRRTRMARSMNTQRRPPREDQPTRIASSYTAGANRSAKAMVSMEEWEGFG